MKKYLIELGWDEAFERAFEKLEFEGLAPGRVIREDRGKYIVDVGGECRAAILGGTFRREASDEELPTVGDWVAVEDLGKGSDFVARSVLPRRSFVKRQVAGKESRNQAIASNVDTLFIVSGLDDDLNPRRIQRYLALVWESGAMPILVLNKADLREDLEEVLHDLEAIAPGVPMHAVSAGAGVGLEVLDQYLGAGRTVALLGSSGVGKSTLVNAFMKAERMATQANREGDSRGRHTTTWRELIRLPGGGLLIDLPGMRELQLTGDEGDIEGLFEEIREIERRCRFRDCRHSGEPGCGVEEAIESGELEQDRFLQYLKLKGESHKAKARKAERQKKSESKQETRRGKAEFFKNLSVQKRKAARQESKMRRKGEFY